MLYTKYESSKLCSIRQDEFWKLQFEHIFLTPWTIYATNQNHLNNFGREHTGSIPVEFGQIRISGLR